MAGSLNSLAIGNNNTKCQPFKMNQVHLLPSRFQENMKRDSAWMMSIPVGSLLQSFRNTSGAFSSREGGYMTVKKLGGWEALDCDLRGHITGHLLSAYATLYAQTGSQAVKMKAVKGTDGYVAISRLWKAGDQVEVNFGMKLREESTKDDASKVALVYGPIVMAGKLDAVEHPFSNPTKYNDYYTFDFKIPAATVEKAKYDGLKNIKNFKTKQGIELVPFYDAHHCRYVVYWQK